MRHGIYVRRSGINLGSPGAYMTARRAVSAALGFAGADMPCEINILMTDDAGIREINREYRDIDAPTDVLSFPQYEMEPGDFYADATHAGPETGRAFLGDIVISLERMREQGERFGHGEERELSYLCAHSVLHLVGYDHMTGPDKRRMRAAEKKIMAALDPAWTED